MIGDSVTYDGRTYRVVGFTPTSVRPAQVQLSNPGSGVAIWVDLRLLRAEAAPERAALRMLPRKPRED
ncbi:MAG: hypothetical protein QOE13_2397 [Gaiellaceae bacterium]|nr:hypothetical protein [Gaiellaceae bacterium]